MGDTRYRDVYISWGDKHLMLGIRTPWAGVVYERPAGNHSDWESLRFLFSPGGMQLASSVTGYTIGVYVFGRMILQHISEGSMRV